MKRPVFVVGCPRSGTTLLYSMLVAAGGFAFYRKETFFYDLLPRFPTLATPSAREQFLDRFLAGYLGKVPGLDVEPIARRAIEGCRATHEFLPRFMTAIAAEQQVDRWIEATAVHVLHMHRIAKAVPDALFIHVIRDGRDCALSNDRQGWVPMHTANPRHRLGGAALFWEWMVRAGRRYGRANRETCLDVRFEDLIAAPRPTLERIGRFIDHRLDLDRIAANPVHAMKRPNTSFGVKGNDDKAFNPVGRWKAASPDAVAFCESLIGPALDELGYQRAFPAARTHRSARARRLRTAYFGLFTAKHFVKSHTRFGRFITSTRVWEEQPRPGEAPVRRIHNSDTALAPADSLG